MITKEHILAEIRRTAKGGTALGRGRFEKETGIKQSDCVPKFWRNWSDAVREAGYEPNTMQAPFSEEHLLKSLVSLIRELGRFPTNVDLKIKARNDPAFPSHTAINRLGRKAERAHRVREFCASQGNLNDVADVAAPFAAAPPAEADTEAGQVKAFGFVYLMKSGKYYKIGRSACAEKRAHEIKLQLPEELKLLHKIKTDDPVGIEAYWHQRFSDKRKGGEWFNLSSEDVKAFRRRKFM